MIVTTIIRGKIDAVTKMTAQTVATETPTMNTACIDKGPHQRGIIYVACIYCFVVKYANRIYVSSKVGSL